MVYPPVVRVYAILGTSYDKMAPSKWLSRELAGARPGFIH